MAKASLTLPSGTVVHIEGTPDEVKQLLMFYRTPGAPRASHSAVKLKKKVSRMDRGGQQGKVNGTGTADLSVIVNLVKNCDEAEAIESHILDRSSQVDRTLLPLYIVHEHLENAFGLLSGEISKVATDLGVPMSQPNASRMLSGTAAKYVIGDRVRKKGQPVRYKLSRRGVKYMKSVISEKFEEK